jgi:replicative DNA helicase
MGKTALATNVAYNLASTWQGEVDPNGHIITSRGGIVGFFSLEMSAEQIATRIVSARSSVPADRIINGRISSEEFEQIAKAARDLQSIPLYIDDTGGMSISQFANRATHLKRERGLDLLVVDTVQVLQRITEKVAGHSAAKASTITSRLKALARELEIPILAVSQLPEPKTLRDWRPQLSDIVDAFEQDADVVLLLFREDRYLQMEEPAPATDRHLEWQVRMENAWGKAEIIVAKNRHGPTGTVHAYFDAALTLFSDLALGS